MHTDKHVMEYVNLALAFHEAVRNFDDSGYTDQEQSMLGMKFHRLMTDHAADVLYDTIPIRPSTSPVSDYQIMRTCPALRRAAAVAACTRDFAIAAGKNTNAMMIMTIPAAAAVNAARNDALVQLSRHMNFRLHIERQWPELAASLMEYAERVWHLPSLAERTEEERIDLHINLFLTPEYRSMADDEAAKLLEYANLQKLHETIRPVAERAVRRREEAILTALQKLEHDLKLA